MFEIMPITWEAFATLATGALAVGAAAYVGHRQVVILDQQSEIERMSLRISLFEKRFAALHALNGYSIEIRTRLGNVSDETRASFFSKIYSYEFLFGAQAGDLVDQIWQTGNKLESLYDDVRVNTNKDRKKEIRELEVVLSNKTVDFMDIAKPMMYLDG